MKYVKGFLMAWGTFTSIPCPCVRWQEEYRGPMLNMLPVIGTLLGVLCLLVWALLDLAGADSFFTALLITALYFGMTGFIHLDGFMDCSDAILSRRPTLEERRRILKDSHVGAFAVIALVFMVMLFAGAMTVITQHFTMQRGALLLIILTASREFAAYDVIHKKPMMTSQYHGAVYQDPQETGLVGIIATAVVSVVLYGLFVFDRAAAFSVYNLLTLFYTIVLLALMRTVTGWCGKTARTQLGGMSGDISGCMIVLGELTGVVFTALMTGFFL